MEKLMDKFIKKFGLSPKINLKLFNETESQGINLNIKKFKNTAPEIVSQLEKVKNNKTLYQNLQAAKFFATTAIPIAIMGFVLPKLNFLYTKKKLNKIRSSNTIPFKAQTMDEFMRNTRKDKNLSFCGLEKIANMSQLQKMMILDGGLTVGRVKTGRNKSEKAELAFKMAGMCYLNYLAPKKIEKLLNKLTKTIFGINTDLDVKVLNDKNFIKEIKNQTLLLPKANNEKAIIDFIDNNPDCVFVEQIKNLKLISTIKNGLRDPRCYVETDKIAQFKNAVEEFSKSALKSDNVEQFAKKALRAKSFNTVANVAISSFLLAVMLPRVQFLFRKLITGSNLDPGIKNYAKE